MYSSKIVVVISLVLAFVVTGLILNERRVSVRRAGQAIDTADEYYWADNDEARALFESRLVLAEKAIADVWGGSEFLADCLAQVRLSHEQSEAARQALREGRDGFARALKRVQDTRVFARQCLKEATGSPIDMSVFILCEDAAKQAHADRDCANAAKR